MAAVGAVAPATGTTAAVEESKVEIQGLQGAAWLLDKMVWHVCH
jgi:hypothetical protein